MNKTILIAGGTAVVSLAVGTAGGYLIAKKRFEDKVGEEIAREVDATKKYYSVLLMQAKEQKPDSPADIPKREEDPEELDDESEPDEEELSAADKAAIAKGRAQLVREAKKTTSRHAAEKVLTDYQGISTKIVGENKPPLGTLVDRNIFADAPKNPTKNLPPRGPGGAFRKQTAREVENDPPQIIDAETFLLNDMGHDQQSLLYFINDKTLVLVADPSEAVDINLVGEVNLTLFPDVPEDEPSMIYVQNDGMSTDYEIKRMPESLTAYIGLGENGDEELDQAAYL